MTTLNELPPTTAEVKRAMEQLAAGQEPSESLEAVAVALLVLDLLGGAGR
jgi:hypothetical protein